MIFQLNLSAGSSTLLAIAYTNRIPDATRNRNPAKVSGGKELKPTLIANQVDPQTKQSDANTAAGRISLDLWSGMLPTITVRGKGSYMAGKYEAYVKGSCG